MADGERQITKRREETFRADEYVHFLKCGHGFRCVYTSQNV